MKPHDWPACLGAVTTDGRVCAGKRGRATYVLLQGQGLGCLGAAPTQIRAALVKWAETPENNAILAQALRAMVNRKRHAAGKSVLDRSMVCAQVIEIGRRSGRVRRLYLYEGGYHGTLWPRWFWDLPSHMSYAAALWFAIGQEATSEAICAKDDPRLAAIVEGEDP